MTKQPYAPNPGTIPHRVIEHLRTLPAGTALSLGEILDALDCSSRHGFGTCMRLSREAGLVKAEPLYIGSSALYWSLGDGTPYIAPRKSDDKDVPLPSTEINRSRTTDTLSAGLAAWAKDGDNQFGDGE